MGILWWPCPSLLIGGEALREGGTRGQPPPCLLSALYAACPSALTGGKALMPWTMPDVAVSTKSTKLQVK
ncbi:hypothetical protein Y1Q_0008737 [Alligator mississippiensis]|uniref:Uncharacterized protein n=1 Tax=Alligator mississippiensis TaxID=8496 RepID=A0A151N9Q6_ALLMI|nr:hypothetical protein Y1Q_0008737 [Alligator mississippiensis]